MTQPESSNKNEPSKLSKLTSGEKAESPMARLPRLKPAPRPSAPAPASPEPRPSVPAPASPEPESGSLSFRFLPAFWTVASVLSLTVNIILIALLLVLRSVLGVLPINDKASGIIGGLYNNFVLMQESHIRAKIPINQEIPVTFDLNVNGPTDVILSRDVTIEGAAVTLNTGTLTINSAPATIVLRQGTRLPINIDGLTVKVDKKVPAVFDVDVDIPLADTDLAKPFSGLQGVVRPYLCILQPKAVKPSLDPNVAPESACP